MTPTTILLPRLYEELARIRRMELRLAKIMPRCPLVAAPVFNANNEAAISVVGPAPI